jgi:hypothetical protein
MANALMMTIDPNRTIRGRKKKVVRVDSERCTKNKARTEVKSMTPAAVCLTILFIHTLNADGPLKYLELRVRSSGHLDRPYLVCPHYGHVVSHQSR